MFRYTQLKEVEKILVPVGSYIWGRGGDISKSKKSFVNAVVITETDEDRNIKDTPIYFRYHEYDSWEDDEWDEDKKGETSEGTGFHDNSDSDYINKWGMPVMYLEGDEFWYAIKVIRNWIPQVIKGIEEREFNRLAYMSENFNIR